MPGLFLFELLVFLFSIVIHEISHGFAAERLGDPTARNAGRLTLNPLKHIDPIGSVLLPLVMSIPALWGGQPIIFGWAKPVPYNPHYLKNPRLGGALIAAAGPASNLLLAAIFGLLLRFVPVDFYAQTPLLPALFSIIVFINILLAVFNLLPIPPLDGAKVFFSALPPTPGTFAFMRNFEQFGFLILLFLLFSGGLTIILPIIQGIYGILVGRTF